MQRKRGCRIPNPKWNSYTAPLSSMAQGSCRIWGKKDSKGQRQGPNTREQCPPDTSGQLHAGTHSGYHSLGQTEARPDHSMGRVERRCRFFPLRAATTDCCFPETMKYSQATGHLRMFRNPQCWSLRSPKQNLSDCLTLRYPQERWHYTAYL